MTSGLYRVRIDRPDGTHAYAESPVLSDALSLVGLVSFSDELRAAVYAMRVLDKVLHSAASPLPPHDTPRGDA